MNRFGKDKPTYARMPFNNRDQLVDIFGGRRDYISREELAAMMDSNARMAYMQWMKAQAYFDDEISRGDAVAPLHQR